MPHRKGSYLTSKLRQEELHRILPGTVQQDEAFEIERGEISCCAFKPIFTCMLQVESADDGPDGDVRTGFTAGFDRVDDPGMAAARDQHTGGQQKCLLLRDEIRRRTCFVREEMPATVLAGGTRNRSGQKHAGVNLGESADFMNLAFRQDTPGCGRHRDLMFRAVVVQTPARFRNTSPDIDRSLRRRVKSRKPARVVVMPVRQDDIRNGVQVKFHSCGVREQSLTRTRIEQNPPSIRLNEQRQPELRHKAGFDLGIDENMN